MATIQCDEHIKKAVSVGLKAKGITAYSSEDRGLKGLVDEDLLEYCTKNNSIILTSDDDFLGLAAKQTHKGIIFITTQSASVGDVIRSVVKLVDTISDKDFENAIFYIP